MLKNLKPFFFYLLLVASIPAYVIIGYHIQRTEYIQLFAALGFLLVAYAFLNQTNLSSSLIRNAIGFSLFFRFCFLFAIPQLSDDYFRFIWDGRLFSNNINPFAVLPSSFIELLGVERYGINRELYQSLNSPDYYTIYPPVLQYIFRTAASVFPTNILGSVFVMRLFILAAEAGTIFLIVKLLEKFELPSKNVLLYALNPLVITELTGNLHFEAVMILFLLLSVYLLAQQKLLLSAICFALAVSTKLLPLMFLPLLINRIGWKKSAVYYFVTLVTVILLFIPFVDYHLIENLFSSVNLYFTKFEFNASVYYIVRWVGYQIIGYNIIAVAGTALSMIAALIILTVAFYEKKISLQSLFITMLFCITVYFLFSTIVHPWYVTSLVAFSVFGKWRFPIIWSALIFLTYYTYRSIPYAESLWLVAFEYILVFAFTFYEWKLKTPSRLFDHQVI